MEKQNKVIKNDSEQVLGVEIPKTEVKPEKDLVKAKLITFLNGFSYPTVWDEKHTKLFESVLAGNLVSSQLTEFASLGYFLKRKNIKLFDAEKKLVDFTPVFAMSETLKDEKKVKADKLTFGTAKIKFHTKFLADYGLVFASIARGVKDYGHVEGVNGKEGQQILSFISLLSKLGYTYK